MDETAVEEQAGDQGLHMFTESLEPCVKSAIAHKSPDWNRNVEDQVHWRKTDCEIKDSNEYDFSHKRRGVAFVIVNEKSTGEGELRTGCQKDRKMLKVMFQNLGFDVQTYMNVTISEMKNLLLSASNTDYSDCDCFAMAISSHGDYRYTDGRDSGESVREDVINTVDGEIGTREILEYFTDKNCPSLNNKPKIFFIQACRGTDIDGGQEVETVVSRPSHNGLDNMDETDYALPVGSWTEESLRWIDRSENITVHTKSAILKHVSAEVEKLRSMVVNPAPCSKDFLVMYATPPGFYAFRRPKSGSWFVKILYAVLSKSKGQRSLLRELTSVTGLVARDMLSRSCDINLDSKKQTPVIYSMLTKDVKFTPKQ